MRKGKLTVEAADAARHRVHFTDDLAAHADRHLVVEAVTEAPEVKLPFFSELDRIVADSQAVLATNTSSISRS